MTDLRTPTRFTAPPTGRPMASFNLQQGKPFAIEVPFSRANLMRRMESQGTYLRGLTRHITND